MFKDDLRSSIDGVVLPMTRAISWLGITPNMVTFANFGVNLVAAFFLAKGYLIWAGILILFAGVLDHMDGFKQQRFGTTLWLGHIFNS